MAAQDYAVHEVWPLDKVLAWADRAGLVVDPLPGGRFRLGGSTMANRVLLLAWINVERVNRGLNSIRMG